MISTLDYKSGKRVDETEQNASIAASWKPAKKARASKDVVAQIRQTFFRKLKAGDWIGTEAELARRFEVSRITIRDAVRSLEAEGVLEVKVGAGGGLRVAKADPERSADALAVQLHLLDISWQEVAEAMLAIELTTTSRAAQNATPEQILRLRAIHELSEQQQHEPEKFTCTALDFHLMIAEASGNRALKSLLRALRCVQYSNFEPNTSVDVARGVCHAHKQILYAIACGDSDAARNAMRVHIQDMIQHGNGLKAVM